MKHNPLCEAEERRKDLFAKLPDAEQRVLSTVNRLEALAVVTRLQRETLHLIASAFVKGKHDDLRSELVVKGEFKDAGASGRGRVAEIRRALLAYYSGAGYFDPIRILIPAERTTKRLVPDIEYRPYFEPFNHEAENHLRNAQAAVNQRTLAGYAVALGHMNKVLASYPDHPKVLSLKAEVLLRRAMYGCLPRPELEEAQRLVHRSIEQTDAFWQTHRADACVKGYLHWKWDDAKTAWDKALSLPGGSEAVYDPWYLSHLLNRGQRDEVVNLVTAKYLEGGFLGPAARTDIAIYCLLAGDRAGAAKILRDSIESSDSNYYLSYLHLALTLEKHHPDEALKVARSVPLAPQKAGVTWGLTAFLHGRCGHRARAHLGFWRLVFVRRFRGYVPANQIAMAALGAGRREDAVRWLSLSADDRDPLLDWLLIAPWLNPLHELKSFQALARRIGLSPQSSIDNDMPIESPLELRRD